MIDYMQFVGISSIYSNSVLNFISIPYILDLFHPLKLTSAFCSFNQSYAIFYPKPYETFNIAKPLNPNHSSLVQCEQVKHQKPLKKTFFHLPQCSIKQLWTTFHLQRQLKPNSQSYTVLKILSYGGTNIQSIPPKKQQKQHQTQEKNPLV